MANPHPLQMLEVKQEGQGEGQGEGQRAGTVGAGTMPPCSTTHGTPMRSPSRIHPLQKRGAPPPKESGALVPLPATGGANLPPALPSPPPRYTASITWQQPGATHHHYYAGGGGGGGGRGRRPRRGSKGGKGGKGKEKARPGDTRQQ